MSENKVLKVLPTKKLLKLIKRQIVYKNVARELVKQKMVKRALKYFSKEHTANHDLWKEIFNICPEVKNYRCELINVERSRVCYLSIGEKLPDEPGLTF